MLSVVVVKLSVSIAEPGLVHSVVILQALLLVRLLPLKECLVELPSALHFFTNAPVANVAVPKQRVDPVHVLSRDKRKIYEKAQADKRNDDPAHVASGIGPRDKVRLRHIEAVEGKERELVAHLESVGPGMLVGSDLCSEAEEQQRAVVDEQPLYLGAVPAKRDDNAQRKASEVVQHDREHDETRSSLHSKGLVGCSHALLYFLLL